MGEIKVVDDGSILTAPEATRLSSHDHLGGGNHGLEEMQRARVRTGGFEQE